MKTIRLISSPSALAGSLLLLAVLNTFAQTSDGSDLVPTVTIQATDNHATWSGDVGTFTVFRSGNPTQYLNVYCCISGTASNGVDYQSIGNFVQLPSGVLSNSISINPVKLGQMDIKTVTVELCPSPLMMPVNYGIGSPSSATVFITPSAISNLPPVAQVISPTNGAVFHSPVDLTLLAKATDADGSVSNVEFFQDGIDLGAGQPVVLDPPGENGFVGLVYRLQWSKVPPGDYAITAVATDDDGASTPSDPVRISVLPPPPPNQPPVVRITSPPNGAVFRGPIHLPLFAYAFDPDGSVASVEFFDDTISLGFGHPVSAVPPPLPPGEVQPPILVAVSSNFWELIWSNAPVGVHALTALAMDNSNAVTRSKPVLITVLPSPPPPTNRPAMVSIIASDPVAIEGTNCWPWLGLTNGAPSWSTWADASATFRWFTNCGPKNATFTVHRHGTTNDDLTIAYDIGGTASNGVEYVALPGVVTIPAGERSALVNIVPIDDGPPDITSTVRLKLVPDTNVPPAYLLGFPRTAAAIILDGPGPNAVANLLPDRCFHLAAAGPDGAWFHIEYSEDCVHWIPICTNQVVNGRIDFIDPDAPGASSRFYRAVPEANPPAE